MCFTLKRGIFTNKGDNCNTFLQESCPFSDFEFLVKKQLQPCVAHYIFSATLKMLSANGFNPLPEDKF